MLVDAPVFSSILDDLNWGLQTSKSLDTIIRDAFRELWIRKKMIHSHFEVRKISFNFNIILIGTIGKQEIVVVLNPLQPVGDDDRATSLSVFQGA